MLENSSIEMTRKQLYDEIWEISVAGVAKKYNLPYTHLIKQIKDVDIPIPPSGYWTKLNFNKPVTKIALSGPVDEIVLVSRTPLSNRKKKLHSLTNGSFSNAETEVSNAEASPALTTTTLPAGEHPLFPSTTMKENASEVAHTIDLPETCVLPEQAYTIYDREILYNEIWLSPLDEIAKRYAVSDVAIRKMCFSLDIPTPPAGYWAKLRAGKPVTRTPLPVTNKPTQKSGIRAGTNSTSPLEKEILSFLCAEDRSVVLSIATQIRLPDENAKMHPTIVAHRKAIIEWKKKQREQEIRVYNRRAIDAPPPFLVDTVSEEVLPRVFHIFDALIKAMEPLDCSLTSDLKFVVNGEPVAVSVTEVKDEIKHIPTKEENLEMLKYEEDKRRYSWASKPKIRKYDYVYNGRITFTVNSSKIFRDCKSYVIEDRLGDLMISFYQASDILRQEREDREEAERRRKEEEHRKEERRQRVNEEVDQTLILGNLSEDYDIACKIRRYIAAVKRSGNLDPKTLGWIEWANAKADWYDPTIAREDEFFGKRDHRMSTDQKKLERKWW
ncbi:hypothetical protein ABEW19_27925 [Paenibacillus illinoisensis]|uniref:hypothetical protein n=1 Tax=Paenibacillus illinoisensis TaxID=59845 RepID=UPI003D269D16